MADLSGLYPQPVNPASAVPSILQQNPLGAAQGILNLQQIQSQRVAGQAFQDALNPDGSIDPAKLTAGLQTPEAAFAAPEAISRGLSLQGSALANRGQDIANATGLINQGAAGNAAAANLIAQFAQLPNPTQEDVLRLKTQLAQSGLPAPIVGAWGVGSTPGQVKKLAATAAVYGMGPAAAATPTTGAPSPTTGAPTVQPLGATVGAGTRTVGLPLGSEAPAAAYNSDLLREASYGQEMYPMQRALDLAKALGPSGTGPGTAGRNNFASFINTLAPSIAQWLPGVDPTKIKDFDEFNKYVTQAAQTRAAGIGAHTDQQLATTLTANPSAHINNLATEDVLKANIALRNMQRVQTLEAAKAGPVGYATAGASVAGKLDPRAFLLPMLTPEQRQGLASSLKGAERTKFNQSVQMGIEHGAIDPTSLAPPSAATPPAGQ